MSGEPVAFGGACAFAVSLGPAERAPRGKSEHALVVDGVTYLFAGSVPKALFRMIPGSAARAQRRWNTSQA